jgi:hypothetical protein
MPQRVRRHRVRGPVHRPHERDGTEERRDAELRHHTHGDGHGREHRRPSIRPARTTGWERSQGDHQHRLVQRLGGR